MPSKPLPSKPLPSKPLPSNPSPAKASPAKLGIYHVLLPTDIPTLPLNEFAGSVLEGLSERPKRLSSRYLYDDRGSGLFRQIMTLEEYYPTRCEAEIIEAHGPAIAARFAGTPVNLVDLGAGDGAKTVRLLHQLQAAGADVTYVPIDISEQALRTACETLAGELPGLPVKGLVAEYIAALHWLTANDDGRVNLVLFLGSNIGNFNRAQARTFLRQLWSALNPGDYVLTGFDLKKDIDLLLAAYNDAKGVTAAFNMNLLNRINRELGGHFDLDKFRHYSTYDVFTGAMESYLVSMEKQTVAIDTLHSNFHFDAWEPIHTEYSYKYLESDIRSLADSTGFAIADTLHDSKRWFADSLWRVVKTISGGGVAL